MHPGGSRPFTTRMGNVADTILNPGPTLSCQLHHGGRGRRKVADYDPKVGDYCPAEYQHHPNLR